MNQVGEINNGYRDRLCQFCKLYEELEIEFLEFEKIVPYSTEAENTYSPKLRPILQTACTDIEGVLKFLIEFLKKKPKQKNFMDMFKQLNSKNMLSIQKVSHRESRCIFTPFELGCNRYAPFWWRAYNKTKHELPEGAKCATIENTINALGALLILLHTSRILIESDDPNLILDCNNWTDNENSQLENILE